jgi:hypothetical protein
MELQSTALTVQTPSATRCMVIVLTRTANPASSYFLGPSTARETQLRADAGRLGASFPSARDQDAKKILIRIEWRTIREHQGYFGL